jgi:hypothetical protein
MIETLIGSVFASVEILSDSAVPAPTLSPDGLHRKWGDDRN